VVLGLAALTIAVFLDSIRSGMVYDNQFIIRGDPRLRALTWVNLRLIFGEDYWYPKSVDQLYRPLTTLSFLLNYTVLGNGDAPVGYHWINIGLHVVNVVLVYFLMLRIVDGRALAASIAAVFALHPVTVESVTNIVGRADLLAGTAVLAGLLVYIRSTESVSWRAAWLVLLALTAEAGVLCKENAIVIAGLLPLYTLTHGRPGRRRTDLATGYLSLVPAVFTLLWVRVVLFDRWALPPMVFADNPMRAAGFVAARLTAIKVIGKYLWLSLFPLRLSADYSFDQIPVSASGWEVCLALTAVAALAGWALARRRSAVAFLVLFFFVTLLPTSNLIVLIDSVMGERFLYLPVIGVVGCAVLAMSRVLPTARVRVAALAAAVVLLGVRTAIRNGDWESNLSLWTSGVAAAPRSARARRLLAWAMLDADPTLERYGDAALREAKAATAILDPLPPLERDEPTYYLVGVITLTKAEEAARANQPDAARALFRSAARAFGQARIIDRRYSAQHRARDLARGRAEFEVHDVGQPGTYEQLGHALSRLGRHRAALAAYRYMRHLDPKNADAYRRIADEQVALGRYEDAAITIVQLGLMGAGGPAVGERAVAVYAALDDGGVPAVVRDGDAYQLNLESPLVHRHVCAAARGFARIARRARRYDQVDQARRLASENRCDGTAGRR